MKEGAWVNAETGKFIWIKEHANFARSPEGQQQLGLDKLTIAKINSIAYVPFSNGPAREQICTLVMCSGWIRFRGHGASATCEFYGDTYKNLWASYKFLANMCGPMTYCVINNLKSGECIQMPFQELSNGIRTDEQQVMKIARKMFEARGAKDEVTQHLFPDEKKFLTAAYKTCGIKEAFSAGDIMGFHPKQAGFVLARLEETGHAYRVTARSYQLTGLGGLVAHGLSI